MSSGESLALSRLDGLLQTIRSQLADIQIKLDLVTGSDPSALMAPWDTNHAAVMDTIVKVATAGTGYTEEEILSKSRPNGLVEARHIVVFLCWSFTTLGTIAIGSRLNRDHGSVLHALQQIEARVTTEPDFSVELNRLTAAVHKALGKGPCRDFSNLRPKSKEKSRTPNEFIRSIPNLRAV